MNGESSNISFRTISVAVILGFLAVFLVFSAITLTFFAFLAVAFCLIVVLFLVLNSGDYKHPGVVVFGTLATLAGILSAESNYPSREERKQIQAVFALIAEADNDLVTYQIKPRVVPLLKDALSACYLKEFSNIAKLTSDFAQVIYEPEATSWISWALRSEPKRVKCLTAAKKVADLAPQFESNFQDIIDHAKEEQE